MYHCFGFLGVTILLGDFACCSGEALNRGKAISIICDNMVLDSKMPQNSQRNRTQ